MRLESNSLIDPILLFLLSQITVVLPVIIPFGKAAPTPKRADPPPVVRTAPDLAGLRRERDLAARSAEEAAAHALQSGQGYQAASWEAAQVGEAVRAEQQRQQALEAEARQLEEALRQLEQQAEQGALPRQEAAQQVADLERAWHEKQALIASLERILQEAGRGLAAEGVGEPVLTNTDKRAAWIEVVNNRVIPVDEQHYSKQQGFTRSGDFLTVWTRNSQGETLEEAQRSTSRLMRFLRLQDPAKTFIACNVYGESFLTYRALRKVLWAMKFQVAWDPEEKDNGKLVLGGCSGGDCVTMQPQDPRQR